MEDAPLDLSVSTGGNAAGDLPLDLTVKRTKPEVKFTTQRNAVINDDDVIIVGVEQSRVQSASVPPVRTVSRSNSAGQPTTIGDNVKTDSQQKLDRVIQTISNSAAKHASVKFQSVEAHPPPPPPLHLVHAQRNAYPPHQMIQSGVPALPPPGVDHLRRKRVTDPGGNSAYRQIQGESAPPQPQQCTPPQQQSQHTHSRDEKPQNGHQEANMRHHVVNQIYNHVGNRMANNQSGQMQIRHSMQIAQVGQNGANVFQQRQMGLPHVQFPFPAQGNSPQMANPGATGLKTPLTAREALAQHRAMRKYNTIAMNNGAARPPGSGDALKDILKQGGVLEPG